MEYRKYGQDFAIRIDKGEEILEVLEKVCQAEKIRLGYLNGLGAVGEVTLGVFDRKDFRYKTRTFEGDYEIASCSGNITSMNGKTYLHVHMAAGNTVTGECHGGHLNRGVISLTGEFFIHAMEGDVDRKYSEEIGLNLMEFPAAE